MSPRDRSMVAQRRSRAAGRARDRGPRPRNGEYEPRLEPLEDRTALSTLTVVNNLDGVSVPGSLRFEIAQADPGDTIKFAPGLKGRIITLNQGPLTIAEDLTIRGFADGQPTISGGYLSRI